MTPFRGRFLSPGLAPYSRSLWRSGAAKRQTSRRRRRFSTTVPGWLRPPAPGTTPGRWSRNRPRDLADCSLVELGPLAPGRRPFWVEVDNYLNAVGAHDEPVLEAGHRVSPQRNHVPLPHWVHFSVVVPGDP